MLDDMGGADVRMVPASPELLHTSVVDALQAAEPEWSRPSEAAPGSAWGAQRVVVFSGLRRALFFPRLG